MVDKKQMMSLSPGRRLRLYGKLVDAQVMRGALRLLGVPLDAPPEPFELPGETDHAREST